MMTILKDPVSHKTVWAEFELNSRKQASSFGTTFTLV